MSAGDMCLSTEAVVANFSPSTSNEVALSAARDPPLIVTLAPPKPKIASTDGDTRLTDDEVERLLHAINTNSVTKIAQTVRCIKTLSQEIKRQNNQMFNMAKNRLSAKKRNAETAVGGTGDDAGENPPALKKRAMRTQPAEPRRPWKPERLDPTKPILQCDACGYQANRRDYMRRHQIRVHSDYRPYQCTLCEFKTTEKHDLDRHMNSKYHGGKGITQKKQKMTAIVRIKCDQCSYSSKSVNSILKHKQLHRTELLMQEEEQRLAEQSSREHTIVSAAVVDGVHVIPGSEPADEVTTTESLDETDPVTVLMMNDLLVQSQSN